MNFTEEKQISPVQILLSHLLKGPGYGTLLRTQMLVEVNFEGLVEILDAKRGVSNSLSIVFYPRELAFGGLDKAVCILSRKQEIISHRHICESAGREEESKNAEKAQV